MIVPLTGLPIFRNPIPRKCPNLLHRDDPLPEHPPATTIASRTARRPDGHSRVAISGTMERGADSAAGQDQSAPGAGDGGAAGDRVRMGPHEARVERGRLPRGERRVGTGQPAARRGRELAGGAAAAARRHRGGDPGDGSAARIAGGGPEVGTGGRRAGGHRRGRPRRPTPCRRRGTPSSSCARSPTCARAPTPSAPCSACATRWPSPSTSSSRSAASSASTRRSSPPATAEGAGEMFQVTTLDLDRAAAHAGGGAVDFDQDFFGKRAYLTVSAASSKRETYAMALGRRLHLRPHLPRRELQHDAPPGRVLDDRAGDGLRRPRGRHGRSPRTSCKHLCRAVAGATAPRTWPSSTSASTRRRCRSRRSPASPTRRSRACTYTEAVAELEKAHGGRPSSIPWPGAATSRPSTRSSSPRSVFERAGHRHRLPEGDQGLLHAPQRRRQDRARHGRARARASARSSAAASARSGSTCSRRACASMGIPTGGLLVVPRPAPLRHRAALPASASASSASSST